MAALRIKKGDTVVVIGGKDAGKSGKVIRVEPKKQRLYVEHLNIIKLHQRPRSVKDTQKASEVGGVIEREGPIHISNVMLADPQGGKPTRAKIERQGGKRVRIAVNSGQEIS